MQVPGGGPERRDEPPDDPGFPPLAIAPEPLPKGEEESVPSPPKPELFDPCPPPPGIPEPVEFPAPGRKSPVLLPLPGRVAIACELEEGDRPITPEPLPNGSEEPISPSPFPPSEVRMLLPPGIPEPPGFPSSSKLLPELLLLPGRVVVTGELEAGDPNRPPPLFNGSEAGASKSPLPLDELLEGFGLPTSGRKSPVLLLPGRLAIACELEEGFGKGSPALLNGSEEGCSNSPLLLDELLEVSDVSTSGRKSSLLLLPPGRVELTGCDGTGCSVGGGLEFSGSKGGAF